MSLQSEYQQMYQAEPRKNAAYYRRRALNTLKGKWGIAILAMIIAVLLGAGMEGGINFNFNFDSDSNMPSIGFDPSQGIPDADVFWNTVTDTVFNALRAMLPLVILGAVLAVAYQLFVGAPATIGYSRFRLNMIDGRARIDDMIYGFSRCYGKSIGLYLLRFLVGLAALLPMMIPFGAFIYFVFHTFGNIFENHLSSTLLPAEYELPFFLLFFATMIGTVISMIISIRITYAYRYAPTILAEYPTLSAFDAMRNSRMLMKGKKWRLFCLEFSFIGWSLLCGLVTICTCGIGAIGLLWLIPYINAAETEFYDDITNRAAAREAIFPSLDPNDYQV